MSIQVRLVVTIAVLLCSALSAMILAVVLDARPRIAAENANAVRMTKTLLQADLVHIGEAIDPSKHLERAVSKLRHFRHVHVTLASRTEDNAETQSHAPMIWNALISGQPPDVEKVPVYINGKLLDVVRIVPNEADELSEVWDAAFQIILYGAALILVLLPLTVYLIKRSLRPIGQLDAAMQLMEDGNYGVHVDEMGPLELQPICARLNRLASTLQHAQADNVALSKRIISVQDEERREVARELHDDLGPHLFALRARTAFLTRTLASDNLNVAKARDAATEVVAEIDELQQTNRRVLNRISPPGLLELGLEGAIKGMAAEWRKAVPDIELKINLTGNLSRLADSEALTVYRVCQEGLTNAYRHAAATRIDLKVCDTSTSVDIQITDNGRGLPANRKTGHGIRGMNERVSALGGTITLTEHLQGGVQLGASIPT